MIKLFRKTLAICLIGLGLGILLVLLLPITGWLFIIGVVVICVGFMWLACQPLSDENNGGMIKAFILQEFGEIFCNKIKEGDTYDSCCKKGS